jgi:beta-lactamase class C
MTTFKAPSLRRPLGLAAALLVSSALASAAAEADAERLRAVVDEVVRPLMQAQDIPGMAVAVTLDGQAHVFNYGLASRKDARAVDDRTLFEIGSISKTFTGTLGGLAAARGRLSLDQPVTAHLPELAGPVFDRVSLLDLATYAAGGLPLQFPDTVTDEATMMAFYRDWRPSFPPGEKRLYSNPSIGLFGYAAARAQGEPFEALVTRDLLPGFGLEHTFIQVPKEEMDNYAFGAAKDGRPVRVSPGALDAEAYGIKTTAADLIRFVELSMDPSPLEPALREAVVAGQTGYLRFGTAMQGLGWEIYDAPQSLDAFVAGNAPSVALDPQAVERLDPPRAPEPGRFVNKTGSTNGFGAYAAFLPSQRLGIAILANRNYPNAERVKAAWTILSALD